MPSFQVTYSIVKAHRLGLHPRQCDQIDGPVVFPKLQLTICQLPGRNLSWFTSLKFRATILISGIELLTVHTRELRLICAFLYATTKARSDSFKAPKDDWQQFLWNSKKMATAPHVHALDPHSSNFSRVSAIRPIEASYTSLAESSFHCCKLRCIPKNMWLDLSQRAPNQTRIQILRG